MPVRMLNFVTGPAPPMRYGRGQGRIQETEEYKDAMIALGGGLKPHEFIEIYYPPEHSIYKRCKHPLNCVRLALVRKVKELHLPYDVYERAGKVYVVGRGVI